MQVTIHDKEVELFEDIANGDMFLTDTQVELLKGFSNRVVRQNYVKTFNSKLVQLKTHFEKEFENGCYGIACSDCKLNFANGGRCNFRQFKLLLQDMEV